MKYILMTIVLFASLGAARADPFFKTTINNGLWTVEGETGNPKLNPYCQAVKYWDDGSNIEIVKDLEDGEIYIRFQNNTWDISDEPNSRGILRLNFVNSRNRITGKDANFTLLNKNTIAIRQIDADMFLDMFTHNSGVNIIMPGTIKNARISLLASNLMVDTLVECINKFKSIPLKSTKPVEKSI